MGLTRLHAACSLVFFAAARCSLVFFAAACCSLVFFAAASKVVFTQSMGCVGCISSPRLDDWEYTSRNLSQIQVKTSAWGILKSKNLRGDPGSRNSSQNGRRK